MIPILGIWFIVLAVPLPDGIWYDKAEAIQLPSLPYCQRVAAQYRDPEMKELRFGCYSPEQFRKLP